MGPTRIEVPAGGTLYVNGERVTLPSHSYIDVAPSITTALLDSLVNAALATTPNEWPGDGSEFNEEDKARLRARLAAALAQHGLSESQ